MGNLVGRSLAHFRIDAELGEGGMGVVYRATDEKLRRQVALKVLPESFAKDEDRRRRFMREARSAAAVTHANIATVYEVGEVDGQIFIAMELVEGETLRALIEKGVSVSEGVRIAREIARGLGRAHEKGIVHRDLKPENVMVTRHDEVKILDFGLAKLREPSAAKPGAASEETTSNLTGQGRLLGTPAYMSPEQARGVEVDARTDVFSFGVVLYEMVAGGRPFVGQTTQDVITSVLRDTPARPSVQNPDVPTEIERVIYRCLEKERDARYASGQELLGALGTDVPGLRVSDPSNVVRKVPSAPTVSLVTPGPSTIGAKGAARWRWGIVVLGGVGAVGLGWGYVTRGASSTQGGATGAAPSQTEQRRAPAPGPQAALPTPSSGAGTSSESGDAREEPQPSATNPAVVTPRPRVAPPVSAGPSTTHAPARPKSPDQLFDTQK
jgi:serine/threonine protein kinase